MLFYWDENSLITAKRGTATRAKWQMCHYSYHNPEWYHTWWLRQYSEFGLLIYSVPFHPQKIKENGKKANSREEPKCDTTIRKYQMSDLEKLWRHNLTKTYYFLDINIVNYIYFLCTRNSHSFERDEIRWRCVCKDKHRMVFKLTIPI